MTLKLDTIIEKAVREAVAAHLELHPLRMPETSTPTNTPEPGAQYLTRKEAAEAARISLPTLHQLINEGRIHPVKIGRATRIPRAEFLADLEAGKFSNNRKKHPAR